MATIINHLRNDTWKPKLNWTEDCSIQWGKKGLVLSPEGNYTTSFFEVFPRDGSSTFIRGEGDSLEDAEKDAFKKWEDQLSCNATGHRWSRTRRLKDGKFSSYTNGGCFCLKCNAFKTAMKPIIKLGEWKDLLTHVEISSLLIGFTPEKNNLKYFRKIMLKAKIAGIKIPDYKKTINNEGIQSYRKKSREAVVFFFSENINSINKKTSKIGHIPDYQFKSLEGQAKKLGFLK